MRAFRMIAVVCLSMLVPSVAKASSIVAPGWTLFTTQPGTVFMGVPLVGVPLGSFDFGPPIGVKNTGSTDTIVRRLLPADAPSEAIPIELVALQLMTAVPFDFGAGLDSYFITLQSARGGPASTGANTVVFGPEGNPHGLVDTLLLVAFDLRKGALNGPIVLSSTAPFTVPFVPWGHLPPAGALEIPGVNTFLNGVDRSQDFWPAGTLTACDPQQSCQVLSVTVPEPMTLALLGGGISGVLLRRRRARC